MNRQFSRQDGSTAPREPWLVRLIAAMEDAGRPEIRAMPCEARILVALRAHLALPAATNSYRATAFSLRN